MAISDNIRKQILIEMRSDTQGVVDRSAEEIARLKRELVALTEAFGAGDVSADEFQQTIKVVTADLRFFTDAHQSAKEVITGATSVIHGHTDAIMAQVEAMRSLRETENEAALSLAATMRAEKLLADTIREEDAAIQEKIRLTQQLLEEEERVRQTMSDQTIVQAAFERARATQEVAAAEQNRVRTTVALADANARLEIIEVSHSSTMQDTVYLSKAQQAIMFQDISLLNQTADATGKVSRGKKDASESTKMFSYGILNLSHALQDLQYGFGAVVNNIPLVVTSFGGSMGLAGGLMIAGTVLNVFAGQIQTVARNIGLLKDPALEAAGDIETLAAKIKALESKSFKVQIDFENIREAKKEMELLEMRLAAFNAAKKQPEMQEKVGKAVKGVFAEEAGATDIESGAENVAKIIEGILGETGMLEKEAAADQAKLEKLRNAAATFRHLIEHPVAGMDPDAVMALPGQFALAQAAFTEEKNKQLERQRGFIRTDIVGGAARGEVGGINQILALLGQAPGAFAAGGVSPIFGAALEESKPEAIKAQEAEEVADKANETAEQDKKFRRQLREERRRIEERKSKEQQTRLAEHVARIVTKAKAEGTDEASQVRLNEAIDRETAAEGKADARAEAAGARAEARAAKRAPKEAIKAHVGRIAQTLQGPEWGLSAEEAATAAPRVEHMMRQGVNPVAAARAVISQMMNHMNNLQHQILEMQALQEQAMGMWGPAHQQLAQIQQNNARNRALMNQAGRPQVMQPFPMAIR